MSVIKLVMRGRTRLLGLVAVLLVFAADLPLHGLSERSKGSAVIHAFGTDTSGSCAFSFGARRSADPLPDALKGLRILVLESPGGIQAHTGTLPLTVSFSRTLYVSSSNLVDLHCLLAV